MKSINQFVALLFTGLLIGLLALTAPTAMADVIFTENYVEGAHPAHGIPIPDLEEAFAGKAKNFVTPTKLLSVDQHPQFIDDLDFYNMELAIKRQLARWRRAPIRGTVKYGNKKYPLSHITTTLKKFLEHSQSYQACIAQANNEQKQNCKADFQRTISENYDVYAPNLVDVDPRHGEEHSTFFTAYYTPTLYATPRPTRSTPYGIYNKPRNNNLRRSTRVQIHFDNRLAGKGLDFFYTEDLFELYLLHVQGGGRIVLNENGQEKVIYIHYNGTNNRTFRFISHYMKEKGYIDDLTIESQRAYLKANPEKQREIYGYCPSYVYYYTSDIPPSGSAGVSVTPRRSIATDWRLYGYKGSLAFIQAQRPDENQFPKIEYKPFSRFMLDQDTGGAIKGKGRVDIYHGEDKYSEIAAFNTQHTGNLYYLVLKK